MNNNQEQDIQTNKFRIIAILSLVLIVLLLIIGNTNVEGVLNVSTSTRYVNTVEPEESLFCIQEGFDFSPGTYNVTTYEDPEGIDAQTIIDNISGITDEADVKKMAYITHNNSDVSGAEGHYSLQEGQAAMWYVINEEAREVGDEYGANMRYHAIKTDVALLDPEGGPIRDADGNEIYGHSVARWRLNGTMAWSEPEEFIISIERNVFIGYDIDGNPIDGYSVTNYAGGLTENLLDQAEMRAEGYLGILLYLDACQYAESASSGGALSITEATGFEVTYTDTGAIIGPIDVDGITGKNFSNMTITDSAGTDYTDKVSFCKADGTLLTTPEATSYIFINESVLGELSNKTLTFGNIVGSNGEIIITKMSILDRGDDQRLVEFETDEGEAEDISTTFTLPTLIPQIQVGLGKTLAGDDTPSAGVEGMEFTYIITGGLSASDTVMTDSNGNISIGPFQPSSIDDITIEIKETQKAGYLDLGTITITCTYDQTTNSWVASEPVLEEQAAGKVTASTSAGAGNVIDLNLNVTNTAIIEELTILKKDKSTSSNLAGAIFNVKMTNISKIGNYSVDNIGDFDIETDSDGLEFTDLEIANPDEDITITLTETEAPKGYKILEGPITITLERDGDTLTCTQVNADNLYTDEFNATNGAVVNSDEHTVELNINNIPIMNIGGMVWQDLQTGDKAVIGPDGYYGGENGEDDIPLSDIEVYLVKAEDIAEAIVDTNGDISINTDKIYSLTRTKNNGTTVTFEGITTTGTEQPVDPDAIATGVNKVSYVSHKLNELGGYEREYTLSKGEYLFAGVEKGNYYVIYKYDGMTYKVVPVPNPVNNTASTATEDSTNRTNFNAKFHTIEFGKSLASNGNDKILEYNDNTETGINQSKLITKNGEIVLDQYVMMSKSPSVDGDDFIDTWTDDGTINKEHSILNQNCGLTERFFDLAIGMDIENARVEINDKATTYDYNQILSGELENIDYNDFINDVKLDEEVEDISENEIVYNAYLQLSDYYYRITDYLPYPQAIENQLQDKEIIAEVDGADSSNSDSTKISGAVSTDDELEVFVTYKIIIKNQSTHDKARVNALKYYYDNNYEFISAGTGLDSEGKATGGSIILGDSSAESENKQAKKLTLPGNATDYNLGTEGGQNRRQELYVTLKIKKDVDRNLPSDIIEDEGLKLNNYVEIISYSTEDGLIDNDSEPGNFELNGVEDDTDKAPLLEVKIKKEERTIKGTVWNDTSDSPDEDGEYDADETAINDVIVQLIEIKNLGTQTSPNYCEYIWQETTTGANKKVRTTNIDGITQTTYRYDVASAENPEGKIVLINEGTPDEEFIVYTTDMPETGEYKFTGFIPGNYIIRFIYGDGRTYDMNENTTTYNGQDYKSTKEDGDLYNLPWYDETEYTAGTASVARDNEARRLEVMSYSTIIDGGLGTALDIFADNKLFDNLTSEEKENLVCYYNQLKKYKDDNPSNMTAIEIDYVFDYSMNNEITALTEDIYNQIKEYVSYRTWMCAETSRIQIPVDKDDPDKTNPTDNEEEVSYGNILETNIVKYQNMNFGIAKRPQTKLELEKHVTGIKLINTTGVGTQTIVEAHAGIADIVNGANVNTQGITKGLATIKSLRNERGFWKVETDQVLNQGATLEIEYTYVVKNVGEEDYLSSNLVDSYIFAPDNYSGVLLALKDSVKNDTKSANYIYRGLNVNDPNSIGSVLGQYYYTGETGANDVNVLARVEANGLKETINEKLYFDTEIAGNSFATIKDAADQDAQTQETYIDVNGNFQEDGKTINQTIRNETATGFLQRNNGGNYNMGTDADWSKTARLTTVLTSFNNGEEQGNYTSYLAEIIKYSSASARRNEDAEPENLSYVHSEDTNVTLQPNAFKQWETATGKVFAITGEEPEGVYAIELNENDEFWGETVIITTSTGKDKQTPMNITLIIIASIAVLGVGIILIKKFVLNK